MAFKMVDYFTLMNLTDALMKNGHIKYHLGSKPALHAKPENITVSDCSGFVRYLMYNVTGGDMDIDKRGGTYWQEEWCKEQKLDKVEYSTAASNDGWLRIAFIHGSKGHVGHVWLILAGKTIECHGGVGADRRDWDTKVLKDGVTACFKLALTIASDVNPRKDVMYA